MTHRFFIPPNWITPPTVSLRGDPAHQLTSVLRLQPGDLIIVLDNSGQEWQVRLTELGKAGGRGEIVSQRLCPAEPAVELTLYQGTLKGQKFEWVLQKGTELGVSRFVPVICQRSVVREPAALANKQERWQRIIQEAAEQSGRGRLPRLAAALPFDQAVQHAAGAALRLMPWEEAIAASLATVWPATPPASVALLIGPEGGFTTTEAHLAGQSGFHLVRLGPRLLRAETAGLAVTAAIMDRLGEWD